ncbi:MAG: HPF/RaiA family ribosome-associated protein [bacterium]|nr:HPF/RaiA family ribosome-associated protein [bacterium]
MQIQINAPHESLSDAVTEWIETSVNKALAPRAEQLTRVEVHLQDQNAQKGGIDKRCLIEARPRGMDPLVAEHVDVGIREACRGALDKIQRVLEKRFGRLHG